MYFCFFFFFNDTATTEIYTSIDTLSLHDALPISRGPRCGAGLAAAAHARFDRSGGHSIGRDGSGAHAVFVVEQVGNDHRAELARRPLPPLPRVAVGQSLRRDYGRRHRARTTRARGAVS